MGKVTLGPSTTGHANALAQRLREADKKEIRRSTGAGPYKALRKSIESSEWAYTVFIDSHPEGVFGVTRDGIIGNTGLPWFLMSEEPPKHKREFEDITPVIIQRMMNEFDRLYNYVDVENVVAVKWLDRIGFTVNPEPEPLGPEGKPFHRFEWRKNHV